MKHQNASGVEARDPASGKVSRGRWQLSHSVIIIMGVVFCVKNAGWIQGNRGFYIWWTRLPPVPVVGSFAVLLPAYGLLFGRKEMIT